MLTLLLRGGEGNLGRWRSAPGPPSHLLRTAMVVNNKRKEDLEQTSREEEKHGSHGNELNSLLGTSCPRHGKDRDLHPQHDPASILPSFPSIPPSFHPSLHSSTSPSLILPSLILHFFHPSIYFPSLHLSSLILPSLHPSIFPSLHLFFHSSSLHPPSFHTSIPSSIPHPSILPSILQFIHPSIPEPLHPSLKG